MWCGEVDHHQLVEIEAGIDEVDRDNLHRKVVLLDQLLGDQLGFGPPPPVHRIPLEVLSSGWTGTNRQPFEPLVLDPLRRPHALGDLGAGVGGHQNPITDAVVVIPRIEVVQPAVPFERHGHDPPHGHSLGPEHPGWAGGRRQGPDKPKRTEARQMRVCRASTGGHTGGQGPTRASQVYLILITWPI
jgi:hypothetical protein